MNRGANLADDVGTVDFKAPEIIIHEGGQTEKVDIWAVGVLAFYLFSGGLKPFRVGSEELDDKSG